MGEKEQLIKELLDHGFKKYKDHYFYNSNIILTESSEALYVEVWLMDDEVIFTDRAHLLNSYDYVDVDLDDIKERLCRIIKRNHFEYEQIYKLYFNRYAVCIKTDYETSIYCVISDYIRIILYFEDKIEKWLGHK